MGKFETFTVMVKYEDGCHLTYKDIVSHVVDDNNFLYLYKEHKTQPIAIINLAKTYEVYFLDDNEAKVQTKVVKVDKEGNIITIINEEDE